MTQQSLAGEWFWSSTMLSEGEELPYYADKRYHELRKKGVQQVKATSHVQLFEDGSFRESIYADLWLSHESIDALDPFRARYRVPEGSLRLDAAFSLEGTWRFDAEKHTVELSRQDLPVSQSSLDGPTMNTGALYLGEETIREALFGAKALESVTELDRRVDLVEIVRVATASLESWLVKLMLEEYAPPERVFSTKVHGALVFDTTRELLWGPVLGREEIAFTPVRWMTQSPYEGKDLLGTWHGSSPIPNTAFIASDEKLAFRIVDDIIDFQTQGVRTDRQVVLIEIRVDSAAIDQYGYPPDSILRAKVRFVTNSTWFYEPDSALGTISSVLLTGRAELLEVWVNGAPISFEPPDGSSPSWLASAQSFGRNMVKIYEESVSTGSEHTMALLHVSPEGLAIYDLEQKSVAEFSAVK